MNEYEKITAINQNWFKIQTVAGTPDENLEMFKDTPIYNVLKERREFCREARKQLLTEDLARMFERYNDEIKRFFLI